MTKFQVGYFKGIHPVVFGFSVNYVSIYANRKSLWCFGNFSNPEKHRVFLNLVGLDGAADSLWKKTVPIFYSRLVQYEQY